jgi:hypothetical protein
VFKKRTFRDLDNSLRQSFHIFLLQKQHTVLGMMPEPKVEMLLEMELFSVVTAGVGPGR